MSDQITSMLDVPRDFMKDGVQFLNRSQKPDRKEFVHIARAVGVGFLIMGFVGYIVKLGTPFSLLRLLLLARSQYLLE
ncbi:MAG: Sec61p translocation complex subunit [Stictis urceolatum]|nr:Sec61p translocation complex subunit [Stictis urceolata]